MLEMLEGVVVIAVGVMFGMVGAWTLRALWRWLDAAWETVCIWIGRL